MATPASKPQKRSALDELAEQTIREINEMAAKLSPEERARRDKKTLEIAAKISRRASRGKS